MNRGVPWENRKCSFNGAAPFRERNEASRESRSRCRPGFNGAAPFRERNDYDDANHRDHELASMGPLPFESGMKKLSSAILARASVLQWGRSLSRAE